jgi:hypothetical protein
MKTITLACAFIISALQTNAENLPFKKSDVKAISPASVNAIFNNVNVHRQGRGVAVTWRSDATPSAVTGFTIMKTYDSPDDPYAYWETVAVMPCTGVRSYKFNDQNIFPGIISYVIIANMTNGSTLNSEISSIRIIQH